MTLLPASTLAGGPVALLTMIGIIIILVVCSVLAVILPIIAAISSGSGNAYRYPLTLRLV